MISFSLVYFEGAWTEDEMARVEAAAEAVEASRSLDNRRRPAPWVAVAHTAEEAGVWIVSRYGLSEVLMAGSVEELTEEMDGSERGSLRLRATLRSFHRRH